jgi:hypothetical protein
MTTFSCDLEVPRTEDRTGIPLAWIDDRAISLEAHGFLVCLLSYAAPGVLVSDADLAKSWNPQDPPIAEFVDQLLAADYLQRVAGDEKHYRLVNPDRLPPLPRPENHS